MQTSGLFTTHSYSIPIKYNREFRIVFFGDVHRDSPNHARKRWKRFLEYGKELKDAWFFGMGDYLDSTSSTERACLGQISDKMHETFSNDLDKLQMAKCELLAKECEFMRGRIIGMLNGNHYYEFSKTKTNSDQEICRLLDTTYLGVSSFTRLSFFQPGGKSSRRRSIPGRVYTRDIFAHHGKGAARLIGGSINRVQQMAEGAEADIYAMGHDHKRIGSPGQPRLFLSHNATHGLKVEHREPIILRTGSFLASYEPNVVNYNVDECRPPCSLGHVEVIINVRRTQPVLDDGKRDHIVEIEMRTLV